MINEEMNKIIVDYTATVNIITSELRKGYISEIAAFHKVSEMGANLSSKSARGGNEMSALETGISLIFDSAIRDLEAIITKYKGDISNESRK